MKKPANKAEKAHMARVAEMPCSCCGAQPRSLVHHLREGQGMSQRSSHYLTIPLCETCHVEPIGVHGDKSMMLIYHTDEMKMLADTIEKLQRS